MHLFVMGEHRVQLSASMGLAVFDGSEGRNAREAVREADLLLYRAKARGRNRVCYKSHKDNQVLEVR